MGSRVIRVWIDPVQSGSTLFAILFFNLDWNPYFQQWTYPNSKIEDTTQWTQGERIKRIIIP